MRLSDIDAKRDSLIKERAAIYAKNAEIHAIRREAIAARRYDLIPAIQAYLGQSMRRRFEINAELAALHRDWVLTFRRDSRRAANRSRYTG